MPEEEAQFKFQFLHKIVNVGFEGKGIINQDTKIFIDMNHLYDISLKSGHCGDSLEFENNICLVFSVLRTNFSPQRVCAGLHQKLSA